MQDNAELNMEILTMSNITFSVQCILELIANSLSAHATAIAIRIHAEKREIHVIDNGIGISKDMLKHIAEYDAKTVGNRQQMYELIELNNRLINIRRLSNSLSVASRYQYSIETFMKVFKIGFASNLMQIEQRPSRGTTVSVYGFHETLLAKKWDMSIICFLIGAIAVTKLEVSFSVRDEERKKVVLRIAKPHSPIEVLKKLFGRNVSLNHLWLIQCNPKYNANYHGYVGLSDKNATQWIFLNHEPICCPLILKLIKIGFEERIKLCLEEESKRHLHKKNIFILFFLTFSRKEFKFVIENGKRYVMFYDMQKILSSIKNCIFKCLTEETIIHTVPPYLRKTQLLKQIYLKSEKSIFSNDINQNGTSLMKNNEIMIDFKRTKIPSRIGTNSNKQHNEKNNIKTIGHYIQNTKSSILNSIQWQSNSFTKCTNFYEDKIINKTHNNIYKTQTSFKNFNITNDSTESNKICNYHNGDNNDFVNMISPLSEWSNWTYYTNNKKCNTVRNAHDTFPKSDTRVRQFSEFNNRFNFLPRKLYNLLQHRHVKLTNIKCSNSPNNTISFTENWQHEQIAVRPCNLNRKLCELKLSRASLKCIKVINQVNDEFIVARMMYDEMKILLMIDQHAVHERIRYETLLLRYKIQDEDELLSINLRDPLAIKFPTEICNLFLRNKMLLKKFGINLGSLKKSTLLIRTIPQCLITNNDHCNGGKILPKICSLLNDILKNRNATNHVNTLPLTIHNAIASEACHGAIKFGDKLTLEQCTYLMKLLRYTKFPNRCVHGRPTIIPVMELSELEKRSVRIPEIKLNFASLKRLDH